METRISHLPDTIVIDDEITLHTKTAENYDEFVEIASDNQEFLAQWLPWAVNIPDESSLKHYQECAEKKRTEEQVNWNVHYKGKLAGACGATKRDGRKEVLEIGYWLTEESVGKGIMARSVNAMVDLFFEETTAPSIEIHCDQANGPSAAVAVRCGFVKVRSVEEPLGGLAKTGVHDVYVLTREQWSSRNS